KNRLTCDQRLKSIILHKAALAYFCFVDRCDQDRNYGSYLRYLRLALNCYSIEFKFQLMEQNNNNIDCKRLLSYIMSIAGDCRLMLSHVTSTEENEETTTDIKDLFRKSFENFDAGIHAFENINNILNIALLHSNLCRGLELVENSSDLFENYRTLSWELSNGICVMVILLQDYAPLSTISQEDVEKEVIECTTRALKYLEVELIVHYQIHRRHHQHHYQYYCELQQQHK
ncbi:unnamed protein product, partial [Rotaria sordida]